MTSFDEILGATPGAGIAGNGVLRVATIAYLARYKGDSRMHTESDLRIYVAWCAERRLPPLTVRRAHVEMYVRWLQEIRRFRPSTVSRRLSVVAGFYRQPTRHSSSADGSSFSMHRLAARFGSRG
ncbi:hypothetical protein [Actinomadura sp. 6N118]|uniref:hypothetical protein n=1 Tax=Actinomadura sp. 6N118 TaxID=3375151 RepID=UPI0037A95784